MLFVCFCCKEGQTTRAARDSRVHARDVDVLVIRDDACERSTQCSTLASEKFVFCDRLVGKYTQFVNTDP